ncbi:hypothetical protein ACIHCQ_42240 [Streptomyces sp. NPDC052236]|uniref:hypothetical protein n=1 Tax=Streptomyces sp. NPDC052236 TaxID=3365686 RepID=UPI0037D01660
MSDALPLDVILGPHQAARLVRQLAANFVRQDQLHPDVALRLACERASDGDPLLLAAPGQVWSVQPDVDPDGDVPARRLAIHARLAAPPRVLVSDADDPDSEIDELLITGLDVYRLDTWQPIEALLEGGSQ